MNKFFKSKQTRIILSIVWGFGLACIFRKACKTRNCVVLSAPDPKEITKNVYLFDKKCYKYTIENTQCNNKPIEKYE